MMRSRETLTPVPPPSRAPSGRWAVASGVIASHTSDPLPAGAQPASDSVSTARDAVPIMTYIEVGLFAGV